MAKRNGSGSHLVDAFGNPVLSRRAITKDYDPPARQLWGTHVRDLPLFTFWTIQYMLLEPTIRLGLAMRAAPLAAAEFAYKEGEQWVPGVKADNKDVAEFIHRQLQKIWQYHIQKILTSQQWGWSCGEVMYRVSHGKKRSYIEIDDILPRDAGDGEALVKGGQLFGVRFSSSSSKITGSQSSGYADIQLGKAYWHAFDVDSSGIYGRSVLRGTYSPWADKWFDGGALDVRRLFMHADAYGGKRVYYPPGTTNIDGVGDIPNRDIAREMAEQAKSGEVWSIPSEYDDSGNPLWKVEDSRVTSNPQHILQYPKDLDVEMLRGMEIPDDILTAEATGAWAGKQVPMMAFYMGLNLWLNSLIGETIRPQILEPLIMWNYGKAYDFEVQAKPLHLQALETQQQAEPEQPQEGQGGTSVSTYRPPGLPAPTQMSLEEEVGQRVGVAADIIQRTLEAVEDTSSMSATMFVLGDDDASDVLNLAATIDSEDLHEKGIEENPHITVLYGIGSSDDDQVRHVLKDMGPIAVRVRKTSVFETPDYDVVHLELESNGLRELHDLIELAVPNINSHPDYKPHITVAYVKPGQGGKYAMRGDLDGKMLTFDELVFSDKDRNYSYISLKKGGVRFSATGKSRATVEAGKWKRAAELMEMAQAELDQKRPAKARSYLDKVDGMGGIPSWFTAVARKRLRKYDKQEKSQKSYGIKKSLIDKFHEAIRTGAGPRRVHHLLDSMRMAGATEKKLNSLAKESREAKYKGSKRRFRNGDTIVFKPYIGKQCVAGRIVNLHPITTGYLARVAYLDPENYDGHSGSPSTAYGAFRLIGNTVIASESMKL